MSRKCCLFALQSPAHFTILYRHMQGCLSLQLVSPQGSNICLISLHVCFIILCFAKEQRTVYETCREAFNPKLAILSKHVTQILSPACFKKFGICPLQAGKRRKFDETVEAGFQLGIDPKRGDQGVRGSVVLPHGTGKPVRVCAFAEGTDADIATAAGTAHTSIGIAGQFTSSSFALD